MVIPLISIIVPTFNRSTLLPVAIDSLLKLQTADKFELEIIIVDDRSTDNTSKVIEQFVTNHPLIKAIHGEGRGYTRALNCGLVESKGDWVALFDDDEVADKNWLLELFIFAERTGAECVGGLRELAFIDNIPLRFGSVCRGLLGELIPKKEVVECNAKLHPGGGHLLIKKKVFNLVGTFDESFLTGGCDRDLVLRALKAGIKMGLTPKARVLHMVQNTRVTEAHIKWYSLQFGNSFAYIDWKRWGAKRATLVACARLGQALFINYPLYVYAYLTGNKVEKLDRRALLWRATGYSFKILSLMAPRLFPQDQLFARLAFRKERDASANC